MKYFSMFSGIGGFELGIQQAYESLKDRESIQGAEWGSVQSTGDKSNIESRDNEQPKTRRDRKLQQPENIGYSELDKYAIQIYEKHFKHKNYGDCTKITASTLPDFDLLVGGFPCQAFSIAGKREGFDDTRGTLFFDIARILEEKRPEYLLLENVKGLLSHDQGRTFKTILSSLTELGYDIQTMVLNSKNFGVPQNRERVFIAGCLGGWGGRKVFSFREDDKICSKWCKSRNKATGKNIQDIEGGRGCSQHINQLNQPKHSNDRVYGEDGISPTLNTMQGGRRQPFVAPVLTPDRLVKRQHGRRIKEDGEPSFTLTGQDKHGVMLDSKIRRLTPVECERLQSFPDGWTEGLSDTQRYKTLGNAVTVNVVREVMKNIL